MGAGDPVPEGPAGAADEVTDGPQRPRDLDATLRRAALVGGALLLVVVAVLAVLVDRADPGGQADEGPAEVAGQTPELRAELPPLDVVTPAVTPEAEASCPALMSSLPLELAGEPSRRVSSESPFAYAWGDPPVVLVCGVPPAPGYTVGAFAIGINGITWYVETSDATVNVFTTVDRTVPVEVRVPSSIDAASVTALSPLISAAIPYTEPVPVD